MRGPLPDRLARAAIPEPVLAVLRGLRERGHQAFLVGGGVRDLLLGAAPKDFDVATSALPKEVMASFRKVVPTGIDHGTVTVLSGDHPIEVTTFRSESDYHDGRRPSTIEFHGEIEEDLSRRDFTVNAIAFDPLDRRLVDPFGGMADLESAVIRCVGDPLARFGEDGLRPLRAVRLAAVLGFKLDGPTEAAIPRSLDVFRKVSFERVREELTKLLLSVRPKEGFLALVRTGLLEIFLPEGLGADPEALARSSDRLPVRLAIVLAARDPASSAQALRRLTYPNKVVLAVERLLTHRLPSTACRWSDAEVRKFAAVLGRIEVPDAIAFASALWGQGDPTWKPQACSTFDRALRDNPPLTTKELKLGGNEIMKLLGTGPSAKVGEAARFLLDQVIEDPSRNSVATLSKLVEIWAKTYMG